MATTSGILQQTAASAQSANRAAGGSTGSSAARGAAGTATGSSAAQAAATRNGARVSSDNGQSRIEINQTFDNFLTLLTTQLKNQDPLSPMDTNQFTSQLVQFSQVEQSMKSNDNLDKLIRLQQSSQIGYAASLTGKEVQIGGDTATLGASGSLTFGYTMPKDVKSATINILDSRGAVVASRPAETGVGAHPFVWDGKTSDGQRAPAGTYRIQVAGKDAKGDAVEVPTSMVRTVAGVQVDQGAITLDVGGWTVPLDSVQAIHDAKSAA